MAVAGTDRGWLAARVLEASAAPAEAVDDGSVGRLRDVLGRCAVGFAARRDDVDSSAVTWPRPGLGADEASSFLRAVKHGIADVDDAGYVSLPGVRAKTPAGRYALLSRSRQGVSVNLEYLIQIGATAELILDHGWSAGSIDFERGEFDARALDGDRVVVAMEAKARVTGPDSLEKLVATWLHLLDHPDADRATNAGRKFDELMRLTDAGPVLVWLVAERARWALQATRLGSAVHLSPAGSLNRVAVLHHLTQEASVLDTHPYDSSLHRPGTAAHDGRCSWHGPVSCPREPVISFQDRSGAWQSGCSRAVAELAARGEIAPTGEQDVP